MSGPGIQPAVGPSAAPAKRKGLDWFLWAMIVVVGLAALAPGLGAVHGPLHARTVTTVGVRVVFYVYGLTLSFAALKGGALNWRLHVAVQAGTFLLFPALAFLGGQALGAWVSRDLLFGFIYLCALPSTISSSVALTGVARGNVPGAVFNATISSLLGIVLTPVWLYLLAGVAGAGGDLGAAILDIGRLLVLPMALGQISRPLLATWAARHKKALQLTDRLLILFLVYSSFCDSFENHVWAGHGLKLLAGVTFASIVLFALALAAMFAVARALKFGHGDRMALVFCGSKKSLAQGVTMAQVLLAGNPAAGLIILPLMIYHAVQLFAGGMLAPRWAQHAPGDEDGVA
jgi:sodium/bile acid cotransporter 7